ncbi:MAG TPA: tetratricopeptide repeat protein [Candidatus Paceibacterota bacterium]|nr:tetratricopeptide repeat protein [Verrucomicrobiota bacterium]HOX04644.1 tetratricopeptide repeat protein [Verrucomicrobiota bacterium]HRZ44214.1 tetratricopeptide repeat protein [Candidatus Paceibacterota bacterium]
MSRFRHLEFDAESGQEHGASDRVPDEAGCLRAAQEAWEEGAFEPALRAYAKALEFNPRNPSAWAGQVRMLIELGEFHEAKVWAGEALERFPREPELLAAKAAALARLGEKDEALAFSDASLEEGGATPYVWLARGDVLLARRERRAEYCFERAFSLGGGSWAIHWLASRIYYFYRQFALALKRARQALALDDTRGVAWLQTGLCQRALGLADPARASLEQALQLNPRNEEAQRALRDFTAPGWGQRLLGWWRQLSAS